MQFLWEQPLRHVTADMIGGRDLFIAVVAGFLRKLPVLDAMQWQLVVRGLTTSLQDTDSNCLLVLADGRWVIWTGTSQFLDITTGAYIAELPYPALEHVSYNLVELFRREMAKFRQRTVAEAPDANCQSEHI
jgi:hypothetical protein